MVPGLLEILRWFVSDQNQTESPEEAGCTFEQAIGDSPCGASPATADPWACSAALDSEGVAVSIPLLRQNQIFGALQKFARSEPHRESVFIRLRVDWVRF